MSQPGYPSFFCSYIAEYCRRTSVHGLNHLLDRKTILEKLLWVIIISAAVASGANLISRSYSRYENNPVVASLKKNYLEWNITFPGTTACFIDKLDKSKAKSVIERYWNETEGPKFDFYMSFLKTLSRSSFRTLRYFARFKNDKSLQKLNLQELMKEVWRFGLSLNYSLFSYNSQNLELKEVLTEDGICYTTSFVAPFIRSNDSVEIKIQRKLIACMYYNLPCFARLLKIPRALRYYIHSPFEIPDSRSKYWEVSTGLGRDTFFSFLNTEADESLFNLRRNQRRCNLREEVPETSEGTFYSFILCRMNCRRMLSMDLCRCIPHFYTRKEDQSFCDLNGLACLGRHSKLLMDLEAEDGEKYPCNCYPSCSETEYFLDRVHLVLPAEFAFSGMRYSWTIEGFSKMAVRRRVIFGFRELLVNLGGIAGFFFGASIISGIEIIYFFTIRLFRFIFKFRKTKSRPPQRVMIRPKRDLIGYYY